MKETEWQNQQNRGKREKKRKRDKRNQISRLGETKKEKLAGLLVGWLVGFSAYWIIGLSYDKISLSFFLCNYMVSSNK